MTGNEVNSTLWAKTEAETGIVRASYPRSISVEFTFPSVLANTRNSRPNLHRAQLRLMNKTVQVTLTTKSGKFDEAHSIVIANSNSMGPVTVGQQAHFTLHTKDKYSQPCDQSADAPIEFKVNPRAGGMPCSTKCKKSECTPTLCQTQYL